MDETDRFAALVLPHLDAAYNLARWLARDAADAEDVVQDACVRAIRYVGSLRGADARPWFLTIVRNAFYDRLAEGRAATWQSDDDAIERAVDPRPGPQERAVAASEWRSTVDAIGALPLQFRETLILRELDGLSYKEIAVIIDAPIGTVMSRLARARSLLREAMALRPVPTPARHRMRGER